MSKPGDPGGGQPPAVNGTPSPQPTTTPERSGGSARKRRTYQEIVQHEIAHRNIIEIKLVKIREITGSEVTTPKNLTTEETGELLFDIIKVNPADCEKVALYTGMTQKK